MSNRFIVMPDYNNKYYKHGVVFEVIDDSNNVTLCYTIRREKANRICSALNKLQKKYPLYEKGETNVS